MTRSCTMRVSKIFLLSDIYPKGIYVVPKGYKEVDFAKPQPGQSFLDSVGDGRIHTVPLHGTPWGAPRIIVEKLPPVVEYPIFKPTGEIRKPWSGEYYFMGGQVLLGATNFHALEFPIYTREEQ